MSHQEKVVTQVEQSDGASIAESRLRDVRQEALNLRTQAISLADSTRKSKEDEELKALQKPSGTAYHCDLFIAHINTLLVPESHPQISKFIKYSQHLFNILHIQDDLLCSNRQFCQTNKQWNPLISRYYYSVLDIVQTLRAMDEADLLSQDDKLFLNHFLTRFPPQSLSIAGPLISYFQSICVSESQYPSYGSICPILPPHGRLHPRGSDNKPQFYYYNYMIPNVPGIISMINQLASPARYAQISNNTLLMPFNPLQSIIENNANVNPLLNGSEYQTAYNQLSAHDKWYFTSPGMEYPNEADFESLKAFSQHAYKYGFPIFDETSRFGTVRKFLAMDKLETFGKVLAMMARANKHFANSGNLGHAPPRGVNAGQIICHRSLPTQLPTRYGDLDAIITGSFSASTVNHSLTQTQAQYAFSSKIHSKFSHEDDNVHPLNGVGHTLHTEQARVGPFWTSSSLTQETSLDEGYLRYPEIIRTKYYLEKPEN